MNSFPAGRVLAMALTLFLPAAFSSSAQSSETTIAPTRKIQLFNGKNFSAGHMYPRARMRPPHPSGR
jgi:hypothetical protein